MAEAEGVVVFLDAVAEIGEHGLQLVQHIVVAQLVLGHLSHLSGQTVIRQEHGLPKHGYHVELLQHGVHVADAARVADAHIIARLHTLHYLQVAAVVKGLLQIDLQILDQRLNHLRQKLRQQLVFLPEHQPEHLKQHLADLVPRVVEHLVEQPNIVQLDFGDLDQLLEHLQTDVLLVHVAHPQQTRLQ